MGGLVLNAAISGIVPPPPLPPPPPPSSFPCRRRKRRRREEFVCGPEEEKTALGKREERALDVWREFSSSRGKKKRHFFTFSFLS